jgi:hypothetical protein
MTRASLSRLQRISRLHRDLRVHRALVAAGRKRALSLTPARRREIASVAGCARWYGDYDRIPCPSCAGVRTHSNGGRPGKPLARCSDCGRSWYVVNAIATGEAA